MSYSLAKMKNFPEQFPPPPTWLVWQQDWEYNRVTKSYDPLDKGQVRHFPSLYKAKKRIADYSRYDPDGTGIFRFDWAIYEWDGDKYVLQFSGNRGEVRQDNKLFGIVVPKDGPTKTKAGGLEVEVEEAIESIAKTIQTSVQTGAA